jgi:hypothetical protein
LATAGSATLSVSDAVPAAAPPSNAFLSTDVVEVVE